MLTEPLGVSFQRFKFRCFSARTCEAKSTPQWQCSNRNPTTKTAAPATSLAQFLLHFDSVNKSTSRGSVL